MIYKKTVLSRILSNGLKMEVAVVKEGERFQAALYVNGSYISGPPMPELLSSPKEEITHWMGNKPSVGLTSDEVARIEREVALENSVLDHQFRRERLAT